LRQDKRYIGTEDLEIKATDKQSYIEIGLFFVLGLVSIIFFITHEKFLKRYFEAGGWGSILGICIILILSPFGAHLLAKIFAFSLERLNEISKITRVKRSN
jgi:multisubunit Na+/H+ antiporter MnhG subunit